MPILARPRQSAHLQSQDQPDAIGTDLRQQALKTAASFHRTAAVTLILVDHHHGRGGPSQGHRPIRQGILFAVDSAMFQHLVLRRLSHVNQRQSLPMSVRDFVRPVRRSTKTMRRGRRFGSGGRLAVTSRRAVNGSAYSPRHLLAVGRSQPLRHQPRQLVEQFSSACITGSRVHSCSNGSRVAGSGN